VTVIRDRQSARRTVQELLELTNAIHACDTETAMIDDRQGLIGRPIPVLCATIYAGPDIDFGSGPMIWIDNMGSAEGVLQEFKPYFENQKIRKIWHNYSFDRHVLGNLGINCQGFGGDTLHMARLWDTARLTEGGYSLESVSSDLLESKKATMKERFSSPKILKDGTEGKVLEMPDTTELQLDPKFRRDWIDYATQDAKLTWEVRWRLEEKLRQMPWEIGGKSQGSLWDFYERYWIDFGELLTSMEREGIRVNVDYIKSLEPIAMQDLENADLGFRLWASQYSPGAMLMNVSSDLQKRQLLFAPVENSITHETLPRSKEFKILNVDQIIEEGKTKPLKHTTFTLDGLGIPPGPISKNGWPQVNTPTLRDLCGFPRGKKPKYGRAYEFFGGNETGVDACEGIDNLCEHGAISTLLNSFILPLQEMVDANQRIHASMNINTETGRLSCRRPNLQNQPALEKDRYKIRQSFIAEKGNKLIVADYGQLELRLLAHITNCRSMIDAFERGGDFHSRTAIGMYPAIAEAIERKEVLLEWDSNQGEAPAPLIKDIYTTERRRAKVLNFSIAYGKTAMGLSKDWDVTPEEAQGTLDLWYSDRPEVLAWQEATISKASRTGYTETLMGRLRHLPDVNSRSRSRRNHARRAAINTPLQGGAADVVMCAMIRLYRHERLNQMGWRIISQIHDELILEGPEESSEEAFAIVVSEMNKHPPDTPLLVDLIVSAAICDNWMEGK